MTTETAEWLNSRTLIGFTSKRGNAWHYREDLQGDEPNHYPYAIPVDDVLRRLFNFVVVETPLYVANDGELTSYTEDDDWEPYTEVPSYRAWRCSDTKEVLAINPEGWVGHQYPEWLVDQVGQLLDDDDLGIGSAGLLKGRSEAWLSVEMADNVETPSGVTFRPYLLAYTSFRQTLASTYKRVFQNVVCDNTLAVGLSESGPEFKVKHTRGSVMRLGEARQALEIIHTMADEFASEIERLCAWDISNRQFTDHLELMFAMPDAATERQENAVEKQRDQVRELWDHDDRVAPWNGSAWGVVQAHNTWWHHVASVRGDRGARNQAAAIGDATAAHDRDVLTNLLLVAG